MVAWGVHGCSGGHAWLLLGVHGCSGGHAWLLLGSMHGCCWGGHAWLLQGDVHGCSGGHVWLLWGGHAWLLLGGHVWLLPGGMCGCSWGVCVVALGGCMVALGGMHGCSWGHAWLLPGGIHGCSGGHAWDTMRYGDTINERAVRILLECILVCVAIDLAHLPESGREFILGLHHAGKLVLKKSSPLSNDNLNGASVIAALSTVFLFCKSSLISADGGK